MVLAKLIKKQKLIVIGLNSGTSADGLDLAAVRVDCSGQTYKTKLIKGTTRKYPTGLKSSLDHYIQSGQGSIDDAVYLDQALGQFYGKAARAFLNSLESSGYKVDLIASHGQTVRHLPKKTKFAGARVNGSLQLGSLAQIAALTKRTTVGDFRQADIALGGEGAPITVAAMRDLCGDRQQSRLIVNVGGMANYFYFPSGRSKQAVQAADCGPGNYISDRLTEQLFGQPYDRNGKLARSGRVNDQLLDSLMAHPFVSSRERSTGFEQFGAMLAEEIVSYGERKALDPTDLIATAATFTADLIARKLKRIIRQDHALTKLYLTGGGVHNSFIREKLQARLGSLKVVSVTELGLDPDRLEAMSYALMGAAAIKSRPMPTRFDGRQGSEWPISGQIVQAPQNRNGKNG